ncbi:MAG: DUF4349 domain-containing protein [Bacteroidota bacterium]
MKTKCLFITSCFVLLTLSIQLSSCGSKSVMLEKAMNNEISANTDQPSTTSMEVTEQKSSEEKDKNGTVVAKGTSTKNQEVVQDKIPQKIVRTADLSFKVERYDVARTKILEIIRNHQASVSSENQTGDTYRTTNIMVIRVGSVQFDGLIEDLLKQAIFVDYKKINADDVTEEFVDVSARLKSKQDALLQYELILKKANTINDILDVQQYIRNLQEEIESMQGRLKYLNNKVELSTVNVTFYEQSNNLPVQNESFGWKLREALAWGWHGFLQFIVVLVYLWPLWLIVGISLLVIIRLVKRARKKRLVKNQPKP